VGGGDSLNADGLVARGWVDEDARVCHRSINAAPWSNSCAVDETAIGERYRLMRGLLNERPRRRWAAAEARSAGPGGVAAVARATDISESTVRRGLEELERVEELEAGRIRRLGRVGLPCWIATPIWVRIWIG
jgi:hypothetical protein